jgi:L-threonylcarbamoyladenylate synthase
VNIENGSAMTNPERISLATLLEPTHGRIKLEYIAHAAEQGAVFVYPTETIYGIGGLCNVKGVKEKILFIKQRPPKQPMILIAPDRSFFSKLPVLFSPSAERLARRFWPGKLTMVLPSPETEEGVALRVSNHPFINAIFRYFDQPLFSTSANISGKEYVNDPEKICLNFSGRIDVFIDAGFLPQSLPSTVVKIGTDDTVSIVREGAVSSQEIFEAFL